jgi:Ankyrin repeats (3 copies)/DnaJ domain
LKRDRCKYDCMNVDFSGIIPVFKNKKSFEDIMLTNRLRSPNIRNFLKLGLYNTPHCFLDADRKVKTLEHQLIIKGNYSTSITYIPHDFEYQEAAQRFVEEDKKRFFAPIHNNGCKLPVIREEDPLKKLLLPFFTIESLVNYTKYSADYGFDRYETYYVKKQVHTRHWIEWHNMTGQLGEYYYSAEDPHMNDMVIYGGFTYPTYLLEKAFSGHGLYKKLKPFDESGVDSITIVDLFEKKGVLAREEAIDRILNHENSRVRNHVYNRTGANHVSIKKISSSHTLGKLPAHLFPAYIYQLKDTSPRVLPAIDQTQKVSGKGALSVAKCAAVGTIITAGLAFVAPEVSIAVRLGLFFLGPTISGVWAKYRSTITHNWDQASLRKKRRTNDQVAESINDRRRRETTEKFSVNEQIAFGGELANVPLEYYKILGLNANDLITLEIVRKAYFKKVKKYHPDVYKKKNDKIHRVFEAHKAFNHVFSKHTNGTRSYYSTLTRPLVKEPPRSVQDNRAGRLIHVMLKEKNYPKALSLVVDEEISPDSHDANENTLLTQAAKDGDLEAVRFAVNTLQASLDTSCDCPEHRTALHYASECGHEEIVEFLLESGANPNLINSRGQTALDIASTHNRERIASLIEHKGGVKHLGEVGTSGVWRSFRSFFGYSSSERTKLQLPGRQQTEDSASALKKTTPHKTIK